MAGREEALDFVFGEGFRRLALQVGLVHLLEDMGDAKLGCVTSSKAS